jgi:glycosyl transferase family 25
MDEVQKFVINLEDRTDRRIEMEQQLRRIGWHAQFSHSGRENEPANFPSTGARGCFLSHLAMLKRGQNMKQHIALMEDDLNFVPRFSCLWNEAYKQLERTDWSIFYPGHVLNGEADGLSLIESEKPVLCTHFLVINRTAITKIIGGLETILSRPAGHPLGGPMHVDGAYSTIRKQNPELKTYVFSPSLGYQRASRSDIANLKSFDRIEALRPTVRWLRRLKGSLRW